MGGYVEVTPQGEFHRQAGDVYNKKATDLHYIRHVEPNTWTMIFTEETVRNWGFMLDGKWIDHEDFPALSKLPRSCGEPPANPATTRFSTKSKMGGAV